MKYQYKTGVIGGTFDRLHEGHKAFLRFAFQHAEIVYVTITSDVYTAIHKPHAASFIEREKNIRAFLEKEHFLQRAKIVSIDSVYGITPEKNIPFDVIFVTKESYDGALAVNERRIADGLLPLALEVIPIVASEVGIPISSTYIRNGVFTEKGVLNIKKEITQNISYLPEKLRSELQQPFGIIVKDITALAEIHAQQLIAVGDVTTRVLHKAGYEPIFSIIDFAVERKKQQRSLSSFGFTGKETIYHAENPAGTITPSLWDAIDKALVAVKENKKIILIIDGEEDLAVLPILLFFPIGYSICYGQPHSGLVVVPVTEDTKTRAVNLISSFSQGTTRGY